MYSTDQFSWYQYTPLIVVSILFFGYEVAAIFDHRLPTISHAVWQIQRQGYGWRCLLFAIWGNATWHLFIEPIWFWSMNR